MSYIIRIAFFTLIFWVAGLFIATGDLYASSRYFYSGDGVIDIASGSGRFNGAYRNANGVYLPQGLAKIARLYGSTPDAMEVRFIEFLDYLQDEFKGGTITITSGYRSPRHNQSLRDNGKLAGKASMHQYGMAADFKMKGVGPEKIWAYVRDLGYGGAGYYHGANVHIDVGPSRFWDETSSKVDTDIADDNKLITLVPGQDIYHAGEDMMLRFIRMTAFPIGVDPKFLLERKDGERWHKAGTMNAKFANASGDKCPKFSGIDEMKDIRLTLPSDLSPGRYRIGASFCEKQWEAMPDEIASYEFIVQ